MQLHYATQHNTTVITLHYIALHCIALQLPLQRQLQLQLPLHCTTLHYLHYTAASTTTLHYAAIQCATLRYTNYTAPQIQLQLHYTNCTTLYYSYNSTTLQLQLQLHYSTLYIQQLWVRWTLQPLQPPQKTQLQPPFGPSVDSLCHPCVTTTHLSYRFPIFETSATALCGTLVMKCNEYIWI